MNKYSSKAVKTAATVGMSLAMVLGNVAPVINTTMTTFAADGIGSIVTNKDTAEFAQDLLAEVLDVMPDYATAYKNTKVVENANPKFVISEEEKNSESGATEKAEEYASFKINKDATLEEVIVGSVTVELMMRKSDDSTQNEEGSYKGITHGDSLIDIATFLANNSDLIDEADQDEDVIAFAKYIKGYTSAKGENKLGKYFSNGNLTGGTDSRIYKVANGESVEKNDVTIYNTLKDNEKYLNAVLNKDVVVGTTSDKVEDLVNDFKAEVEDYKGEREDIYVKDYVNALEDEPLVDEVSVYDAVEKGAAISYKNLSKVEKVLKNIKNDDIKTLSGIADYDDVKDAEEVAYYIDGLQAIIDDMKEVKDILKSTNSEIKAYNKDLKSKVEKLGSAANDVLTDDGTDPDVTERYEAALNTALNAFRTADITELKAFVEDFIGQFYTLTPKQLNSGKYVVRLENADYGRYVKDTSEVFDLVDGSADAAKGLEYLLTTVIDNEESEETYYDQLVNTVTSVEDLLAAVTTGIEGLTFNSQITSAEAKKIVAAKKALNQLTNSDNDAIDAEYKSALTSKEKKEVLANAELINTLYLKLILNGEVTQVGWIDNGNGNWDYLAEDGSRPTKWVAAGSDWYYVKNGTMLRNSWIASDSTGARWYYVDNAGKMVSNTTVNGYTFNSYGVWVQ